MEQKPPAPPVTAPIADIPEPGNAVIFKADKPSGSHFHLPAPNLKLALASFVMLFLVGGVGVGVYLVGQQQQVKSRADESLPENLSAVVPKNIVNQTATPSAKASASATIKPDPSGNLNAIIIPELESSASSNLNSSESAALSDTYDFNGDNAANSIDLSIMYAGWGSPKTDQQKNADLNADGTINGIDYSIFLPYFNKPL